MGLMDKVKSQATQLAEKAQQAGQAGQAKLAEVQAKRKADALLLELGGISYHQRVGRADAGAEARAAELVGMIQAHEAEHGAVSVTSANAAVAESTGVVDPTATMPTATMPTPTSPTPTSPPAPAAPPPAASGGAIPQAQYGSGDSEG
ncbi:MAG TPA: hypothetical protein VMV22_02145 [Acidimicrobiales bacterium]|nr:hypothetical protein [Acidimicrobiales bacterium]